MLFRSRLGITDNSNTLPIKTPGKISFIISTKLADDKITDEERTRLKELQAYSVDILTPKRVMPVDS